MFGARMAKEKSCRRFPERQVWWGRRAAGVQGQTWRKGEAPQVALEHELDRIAREFQDLRDRLRYGVREGSRSWHLA